MKKSPSTYQLPVLSCILSIFFTYLPTEWSESLVTPTYCLNFHYFLF